MKAIKFTGEIGQKVSNSNLATIEMGLSFKIQFPLEVSDSTLRFELSAIYLSGLETLPIV